MGKLRYLALGAVGALGLLAGLGAAPAFAGTVTLNFGSIGADGGAVCASDCVVPGASEHDFTSGGVTVGAIGYNGGAAGSTKPVTFVTQKPASDGADETGIGESNVAGSIAHPGGSDPNAEINDTTWLLIDNSMLPAGDQSVSITIGSLQAGEGANVYSYTPPGGTPIGSGFVPGAGLSNLTLLGTLSGADTGTVSTPNDRYIVITAFTPSGGSELANVVVQSEVISTAVPEPSTWAMLLVGFAGLAFAGYRSRRTAISIV